MHPAYFLSDFNSIVRDETYPMHPGQLIKLPRLSVEVTCVDSNGMPSEVIFHFEVSLDDPSLRWVRLGREIRYVPFKVPAVGESIIIDAPF